MMIATILASGLSTIQDAGRPGFEEIGVPSAGAWHRARHASLALLLGEEVRGLPSIELVGGEVRLGFEASTDCAVVGPARIQVDGHRASTEVVLTVRPGSEVTIRSEGRGPVYVGMCGWEPTRVLGSCSYDTFSRLGGRPLATGDQILGEPRHTGRAGWFLRPLQPALGPLRVVLGPDGSGSELVAASWEVASTARSGTRLAAPRGRSSVGSIDSIPVLPGAVQVTPEGEAIILGVDGGLTGGYPVVGVVASADLDRVSTLVRGDAIRFEPISAAEAAELFDARARSLSTRLVDPARLD